MKQIDLSQFRRKAPSNQFAGNSNMVDLSAFKRKVPESSPSLYDRAKQFGSGLLSGFARSGLQEAAEQNNAGVMDVGGFGAPIASEVARANIPQKGLNALDTLRPNQSDRVGNVLHGAGEFGGGVANFPVMGGSGLLRNLGKQIGTGSAIGGASKIAQQEGVNPLVADIGASIAVPSALRLPSALAGGARSIGNAASRIPIGLLGLGKKGLNKEAAFAARDLGIDLPASALTDSKLTGLAEQYVGKTPYFGDIIRKKYANTEKQTLGALEKIYDETGPLKTPEIETKIAKLYDLSAKSLPETAVVKPTNTLKAINDIKINTAILSPDEKNLVQSLTTLKNEIEPTSRLVSQYGTIKIPTQEFNVAKLIGTKKSLNSIIKWDMDEGVKNQLRRVQRGITEDIAEYGKSDPDWYKTFKGADELYGKVARREKVQTTLGDKATNFATDRISYNALAKSIKDPAKAKILQKNVTPEVWSKIQKLGELSKALNIKTANIPNPSGTAPTAAILGAGIYGFYNPAAIVPAIIGGYGVTKLLTDKKFIDTAIRLAEMQKSGGSTATLNKALQKRMADFGYTTTSLNNELARIKQKEENK